MRPRGTRRDIQRIPLIAGALCASLAATALRAQQQHGAVPLAELVRGLGTNTRVLMIGAHPDDEDTYLISWLARGRHVETGYLSLTRGEGGQNLLGSVLGSGLGIIRTEELLAARRIDGGRQFFTRAYDFGYSKTFAETDSIWDRDRVLRDMLTVIRAFRPHVIVSVWSGTAADGHGHHHYSGVVAREAFLAAGDSVRYRPGTTGGFPAWQPLKLYHRARGDIEPTLEINVGEYNPVIGRSYAELAALSRSQHASQAMGMLAPMGVLLDGFRLDTALVPVARANDASLFTGIDTTWVRFAPLTISPAARAALDSLPAAIRAVHAQLDLVDQDRMVPSLARVLSLARDARESIACSEFLAPRCGGLLADLAASLNTTRDRAARALLLAAGVAVDATASRERVAEADTVGVTISVHNRGRSRVTLVRGSIEVEGKTTELDTIGMIVLPDSSLHIAGPVAVDRLSIPWWLTMGFNRKNWMYELSDVFSPLVAEMVLGEDRVLTSSATLLLRVDGTEVPATVGPIVHRHADPARGEQRRPLASVPRTSVVMERSVEYARAGVPFERLYRVILGSAWSEPDTVKVTMVVPEGLTADSAERSLRLEPHGSASLLVKVTGVPVAGIGRVNAAVVRDTADPQLLGYIELFYPHIRPIRFFREPTVRLSVVDIEIPRGLKVAYVQGVGDEVEPMLGQLGVDITVIAAEAIPFMDLGRFSTLVIGPRAYASNPALMANAAAVHTFARSGGTVVVQYGQDEIAAPGVLPFPVTLTRPAARVSDEKAAVRFLDPANRVLTWPNRITQADFDDWVQERALYMPTERDPGWRAVLSMHDAGEPPNDGAILTAQVGRGIFIYTTLSFFRQLPEGNPGAARLFVNLLSAGLPPVE